MSVLSAKRKRAIALLSLTSIILITLDLQGSASTSVLRGTFGAYFRPIEGVARVVTRPISNAWYGITHYNDVTEENNLLREKIAQQEGAAVAAAASVRLSQELLALNGLPTLAGINSVSAQVIGDSPSNFSQTVEINQGSDSGIKVGNASNERCWTSGQNHKNVHSPLNCDADYRPRVRIVGQGD